MTIGIGRRGLEAAFGRLARRLDPTTADDARDAALATAADLGCRVDEVLRVRDDGRAVLAVEHPVHGPAVLKTSFPAASATAAAAGLANLRIAAFVREARPAIFPEIYEASATYTLERRIRGRPFRRWMESNLDEGATQRFLRDLAAFGRLRGPWAGPAHLHPHEIRAIVRGYVEKTLCQRRYFGAARQGLAAAHLFARRSALGERLDWLAARAGTIRLPRGITCGDMGNVNLLVEEGSTRIFVIDYEYMSTGHHGFDGAYLLAALGKRDSARAAVEPLRRQVLSPEHLGGTEAAEFFAVHAALLAEICRIVHGLPVEAPPRRRAVAATGPAAGEAVTRPP